MPTNVIRRVTESAAVRSDVRIKQLHTNVLAPESPNKAQPILQIRHPFRYPGLEAPSVPLPLYLHVCPARRYPTTIISLPRKHTIPYISVNSHERYQASEVSQGLVKR